MKRNSCYSLAALLLAVCLALTACGASSGSSASSTAAYASPSMMKADFAPEAAEAPAAVAMTEAATDDTAARVNSAAGESTPMDSSRKIVRNAWLSLETKEFDTALSSLSALISEKGGYIESQSEDGRSLRQSGYYSRSASITARVPAEQLDAVISAAGGFCNIVSRSTSSDDITDRYFDSEARLRSLELQEERLLDILSKAEKLDDVITLEQALSEVRYEIESLTASLRRMDSQVAYSTLNIDLSEVVDYQQPSIQPKSFGERIAAAWTVRSNGWATSPRALSSSPSKRCPASCSSLFCRCWRSFSSSVRCAAAAGPSGPKPPQSPSPNRRKRKTDFPLKAGAWAVFR